LDIDSWLRGIGLAQYAEIFRANDIDIELLGRLTNDDLKDIGVVSFGHRKKLLEAIATVPASPQPALIGPKAHDAAERRQVTVMFSDLVGSTALSARMDPEDLREVISAYQKCVAETVQRFGGFVAKYMGDGVLVYFGYPQAHEDDAERAVQVGLALIQAVGTLKSSAPLQARVGIATGLVVGRRSDRIGGCSGANGCWGDGEPRSPSAKPCRAEHGSYRREHAKAPRQSVRASGPRSEGPQGHCRASESVDGAATEFSAKPLRGSARRCVD
jgi:SAM domain (Sterile alpha motif)/Adenylate and Guanylate cyclase catalytic domain